MVDFANKMRTNTENGRPILKDSGGVVNSPGQQSRGRMPHTTNSKKQIAFFLLMGAVLSAGIWFEFSPRFWWLGLPIGGAIGYGINWIRADLAWDKYE
jgi:hypothetical protein